MEKEKTGLRKGLIAAAAILSVIEGCLGGWLAVKMTEKKKWEEEQAKRHEQVNAWLDQRKQFVEKIAAVSSEDLDPAQLESLKSLSEGSTDYSWISAITPETEITDEMEEKLESMPANENDWSRLLFSLDQIPANYVSMALTDDDRLGFVLDYPDREAMQQAPSALDESLESIPLLIQWDGRWGYIPYGDQTIAIAGCGPTAMAMVLSWLNQDPSITPALLAQTADEHGLYVIGAGSSHEIFPFLAALYGDSCIPFDTTAQNLLDLASQNIPMILQMVPGDFTRTGHFIVISGAEDGKLKVNDPNSKKRSAELWDPETVASQSAGGWYFVREGSEDGSGDPQTPDSAQTDPEFAAAGEEDSAQNTGEADQ